MFIKISALTTMNNRIKMYKMKKIVIAGFFLFLISCGEKKPGHEHVPQERKEVSPAKTAEVSNLNDEILEAVFEQYERLSMALVNEDISESRIAANALNAGARLLKNGSKLGALSGKIVSASDIEAQRLIFSDLSNEMIRMAKQSGMRSGVLYVEYCPMAMDDQGAYWLSSDAKIKNPYFGDRMLACGEVTEEIK